jgi:iron(III) transport system permease protein
MNWPLLQNSLLVSGLTMFCAAALGFVAALGLAGLPRAWQNRLLAVAILALVLPPFLVTNCWLHFFGLTGVWRSWLPWNIYSLGGAVWILTALTWPVSLLAALSAWRRLEPSQLEADPALRGVALLRWLLWPMARVSVGQAAVLTFVLALNNFAVPSILQVKVFTAEVWVRFSTNFDTAGALVLSWPLVVAPLLLLLALGRSDIRWPRAEGEAGPEAIRRQLGPRWQGVGLAVMALLLGLTAVLPLVQLGGTARTWLELPGVIRTGSALLWHTFGVAAATASICIGLGLVTWRLRVGLALWLPFLVPGVLLGIGMIFLFNRPGLEVVYQSAAVVILALVVRYLALGWNGTAYALRHVDRDLTDAARTDGASGWSLLWRVHGPQIAPQVGAAWYVTYLLCLWDVETLLLIVPPGGETLALRIFNLLHYGHSAQVNALCVALLGLALAPLFLWTIVRRVADGRKGGTASRS